VIAEIRAAGHGASVFSPCLRYGLLFEKHIRNSCLFLKQIRNNAIFHLFEQISINIEKSNHFL